MNKGKPVRLAGEQPKCRDCGDEFSGGVCAKYCPICRPLHRRPKRTKYVLAGETIALLKDRYDSRVRNRTGEIAQQLGWPRWAVKKAARKLGLASPAPASRKAWTADEMAIIREWAGMRSAAWIARKLGRPESAVILKMKRLDISRRVANGYSVREISQCFGVDHHGVDRWIERGWIRPSVYGGGHTTGWTRYSDDELRTFVRTHPLEFRLDKVDQVWFLGLVLGVPPIDEDFGTVRPAEAVEV